MTDYIERDAIIRLIESVSCDCCDNKVGDDEYVDYAKCSDCHYGAEIEDIVDFPAADVRPVVRGRWEKVGHIDHTLLVSRCSACGYQTIDAGCFCPNCGAEMVMDRNQLEEENE